MAYTFKYGDRPLDGITIQRAVGRGGFGEVYYALTDAGKQIALKYLRDNAEVELRGIANVLNLKSPYLMPIHDVRRNANGEWFVILEYVSGPSLRDLLIAEPNGLGVRKTAFFVNGIAKGLSYLHERGIVHRDLKPGNIFYDDGYVKIGDYGLSKYIPVSHHSGQTMSVGTVHYMAPEIGSGQYTKAIDVYALGVVTYEMLTGKLPFSGSSMAEILMRHLTERPDLSRIPEPFATVIARAMQKDPKDRYQDVNEMVDALASSSVFTEELSNFDPSSIRAAPRPADAADPERTITTPPRPIPPPPLDARAGTAGRMPTPPAGARPAAEVERLARKLQEKIDGWEKRLAKRGVTPSSETARKQARADDKTEPSGKPRKFASIAQLIAISLVVGGVASLFFRANAPDEIFGFAATCTLFNAGATIALLMGHLLILPRLAFRAPLLDRLTYVTLGLVFMIPGMLAAAEYHRGMPGVMAGLGAMLLLCDWNARIIAGRYRQFSGSDAIAPFLIAMIGSAIADADRFALAGGIIAAMIAMTVPAAASLWPPRSLLGTAQKHEGAPGSDAHGAQQDEDRELFAAADVHAEQPVPKNRAASGASPAAAAAAMPAIPAAPRKLTAHSRSISAMIGGLLIFTGIFGAFAFSLDQAHIRNGVLTDAFEEVFEEVRHPKPAIVSLLAIGGILLVFGRRREGLAHIARGLLGVALATAAAGIVMGARYSPIVQRIYRGDLSYLVDNFDRILPFTIPLAFALLLLLWPSSAQRRQRTIVI